MFQTIEAAPQEGSRIIGRPRQIELEKFLDSIEIPLGGLRCSVGEPVRRLTPDAVFDPGVGLFDWAKRHLMRLEKAACEEREQAGIRTLEQRWALEDGENHFDRELFASVYHAKATELEAPQPESSIELTIASAAGIAATKIEPQSSPENETTEMEQHPVSATAAEPASANDAPSAAAGTDERLVAEGNVQDRVTGTQEAPARQDLTHDGLVELVVKNFGRTSGNQFVNFYAPLKVSASEFAAWQRSDRKHCGRKKWNCLDNAAGKLGTKP